jgi:hypothetical protein
VDEGRHRDGLQHVDADHHAALRALHRGAQMRARARAHIHELTRCHALVRAIGARIY